MRLEALRLYREAYPDYGPTLFAEMLGEYHKLSIDSDTLRRWLTTAGLWMGIRAARPQVTLRQWLDGSLHIFWNETNLRLNISQQNQKPSRESSLPHLLLIPGDTKSWVTNESLNAT